MRPALPLVLALLIAGCAAGTPGGSLGGAAGAPGPARANNPRFATQLAGPATFLAPMPTAVVILKPGDLNRNRAFCEAVTRLPTAQQAMAGATTAPNLVLTRWLVTLPDLPADRAADCDFLVGTYDYARAGHLVAAARLTTGSLSGPGPFLLMLVPGGVDDRRGFRMAGLDGSAFAPDDFARFIGTWGGALHQTEAELGRAAEAPGLVRSLFDLVAAIVRTAAGGAGGLLVGVLGGL